MPQSPQPRRRNAVLSCLEAFREIDPGITVNNVITYLYVCENEGLGINELAELSGLRTATASRAIRALAAPGTRWSLPPSLGLVRLTVPATDRPRKSITLTPAGVRLSDRIDALIALGTPISQDGAAQDDPPLS